MKISSCFIALLIGASVLSSCELFLEDKPYIANNAGATSIIFVLADTANLPVLPAGQQLKYVVQPTDQIIAGRFPAAGNTDITVRVSNDAVTSLDVNAFRVVAGKIERQSRGTVSVANREAKFTAPLNTLNFGGTALTGNGTVVLEFVAKNAAGVLGTRLFTVRAR